MQTCKSSIDLNSHEKKKKKKSRKKAFVNNFHSLCLKRLRHVFHEETDFFFFFLNDIF